MKLHPSLLRLKKLNILWHDILLRQAACTAALGQRKIVRNLSVRIREMMLARRAHNVSLIWQLPARFD
jgi:hypothetical protein